MKLSMFLPSQPNQKWEIARQLGIKYAIAKLHPDLTACKPPYDLDTLAFFVKQYKAFGFTLYGLESDEFDMTRIKYGLAGRDEDIDLYCKMIKNCGELGIPMICYNFMPTGWFRTAIDLRERGGALTSGFNWEDAKKLKDARPEQVSEKAMWENFTYFIKNVIPVAEKAGVQMALHLDDPHVSPLHGVARIFRSADGIRKAFAISPSNNNGVTFCQATFKAMGEDIAALAQEFGKQRKIFFVHVRDISGSKENFRETFHDNGPTDMVQMFQIYKEIGFEGPFGPDHAPTMAGEGNDSPGYETKGKIFAIGYFKGIMESQKITIE